MTSNASCAGSRPRACSTPNARARCGAAREQQPAGALAVLGRRAPRAHRAARARRAWAMRERHTRWPRSARSIACSAAAPARGASSCAPTAPSLAPSFPSATPSPACSSPSSRMRRRRAHPRRAVARAPLRRSALRARLPGRHEERPPPLVRHGHLRQSREGRAAPDEAARVSWRVDRDAPAQSPRRAAVVSFAACRVDTLDPRRRASHATSSCASLEELRPAVRPPSRSSCGCTARSRVEYRALYTLVGERWLWRDRLAWTDAELERYLASRRRPRLDADVARARPPATSSCSATPTARSR